jgi:hypothetical protein
MAARLKVLSRGGSAPPVRTGGSNLTLLRVSPIMRVVRVVVVPA